MKLAEEFKGPGDIDWGQFRVSQSLLKSYQDLIMKKADCGVRWAHRWIYGNIIEEPGDGSEAMRAGAYFEYCLTGAIPYHGEPPEEEKYKRAGSAKDGRKWEAGDTKPAYAEAKKRAERARQIAEEMGIRFIATDYTLESDNPMARGKVDIIAQLDQKAWDKLIGRYYPYGGPDTKLNSPPRREDFKWIDPKTEEVYEGCIVIDVKRSGLMDEENKWNPMTFWPDAIEGQNYHPIQAMVYKHLSGGLPFFFWVFHDKTAYNRLIRMEIDKDKMASFLIEVEIKRKEIIDHFNLFGGMAPNRRYCADCILARHNKCDFFTDHPQIITVSIHQ